MYPLMFDSSHLILPEWLSWLDSPFGAALIAGIAFCGWDLWDLLWKTIKAIFIDEQ